MEGATAVIGAGGQELRQHVVAVGGADQPSHRQTHLLGDIAGQNVAEIARRHHKIHLGAEIDALQLDHLAISGEIIDHLRCQPADVDGVCRGQPDTAARFNALGEDLLDPGLGVVEIALHGADADIAALLRDHLLALNGRHAAIGVEHNDLRAGNVPEALQRSLARVAGGSGEDQNFIRHTLLLPGGGDQLGQHGQRHVLKGRGGAPEQLQHKIMARHTNGSQILRLKFVGIGPVHQLLHIPEIRQQELQHPGCHLQRGQEEDILPGETLQRPGDVKAAIRRQALQNRLGGAGLDFPVSRALIIHKKSPVFFLAFFLFL